MTHKWWWNLSNRFINQAIFMNKTWQTERRREHEIGIMWMLRHTSRKSTRRKAMGRNMDYTNTMWEMQNQLTKALMQIAVAQQEDHKMVNSAGKIRAKWTRNLIAMVLESQKGMTAMMEKCSSGEPNQVPERCILLEVSEVKEDNTQGWSWCLLEQSQECR